MKREPFIAHSELTNEIYIVAGKEKYRVTEQAIKAVKAIEALEQEPILDKIRAEIKQLPIYGAKFLNGYFTVHVDVDEVLQIIDKYRGEADCHSCKTEYDCYECEKYEESEVEK